jgi:hypothetical protein
MSLGESAARAVVAVSASTLPRTIRGRYHEQWLADLRDAEEVGLNRGQIALAAVAFAVTASRPWPERRVLEATEIQRRSRLAQGLALGAALLGLSQYATIIPSTDLSGGFDLGIAPAPPVAILGAALAIFAALAPVLAVLLSATTRGIARRTRVAVLLLAVASGAPIVQYAIDGPHPEPGLYLSAGACAYLVGAVFTAIALGLLGRRRHDGSRRSLRVTIMAIGGGMLIAAAAAAGGVVAATAWANRAPLVWATNSATGPASASNAYYLQWLVLKQRFESMMAASFVWWIVAGIALGVCVLVVSIVARFSARSTWGLTAVILCGVLIADGALLILDDAGENGTVALPPVQVLLVFARCAIAAAAVIALGASGRGEVLSRDASSKARRAFRRAPSR